MSTPDPLFPDTRWSLVSRWQHQPEVASRALEDLCRVYWYPVYAYIRNLGREHHEAEDLTQAYFASLIERGGLMQASPDRGKLRTFFCMTAKRFVVDHHRREQRQRRGGEATFIPLDAEDADQRYRSEPATTDTPETLFEKQWANTVIDQALGNLTKYYERRGKRELLTAMLPYLSRHNRDGTQEDVAASFGIQVNAFRMHITRMRQRYQERLRAVVADTLTDLDELEEELDHLMRIFER